MINKVTITLGESKNTLSLDLTRIVGISCLHKKGDRYEVKVLYDTGKEFEGPMTKADMESVVTTWMRI